MKADDALLTRIGEHLRKRFLDVFVLQKITVWRAGDETCIRVDFVALHQAFHESRSVHAHIPDVLIAGLDDAGMLRMELMVIRLLEQVLEYRCNRVVPQTGVLSVIPMEPPS